MMTGVTKCYWYGNGRRVASLFQWRRGPRPEEWLFLAKNDFNRAANEENQPVEGILVLTDNIEA